MLYGYRPVAFPYRYGCLIKIDQMDLFQFQEVEKNLISGILTIESGND